LGKWLSVKFALKLVFAALVVGVTGLIVAANFAHDPDFFQFKWKLNAEPPLEVKFARVGPANITRTVEAPGKVEADVEVKISSQVMGRIIKLGQKKSGEPLREGDRVEAGDLIVQLDRVQYDADVKSAEARVKRLKSSVEVAKAALARSKEDMETNQFLGARGGVSRTDLLMFRTNLLQDEARVAMAQHELVEAEGALVRSKEDQQHTTITSPLGGIVSQLMAKEGEMVVVGTMNNAGTVILAISDPNTMVVRTRVDENSIPLVREGQKALVHFQNNAKLTLTGSVKRISPKAAAGTATATTTQTNDNEAATFETIIALDSPPPSVRLGMTASVEIIVEKRDAERSIPAQAVLHRRARDLPRSLLESLPSESQHGPGVKDPSRRYHQVVFVNVDGKARARLVTTGISDEGRVEIIGGLTDGETVVAGPYRVFDKLKEGRAVKEMAASDEDE
jgi:HlyD family secretion protein